MNYEKLSKEVSYALRHAPWEYELEMDKQGWVDVDQLLEALRREEAWKDVQKEDFINMIKVSEKKRHEIADDKIRAFYGHSFPMHIEKERVMPPRYCIMGQRGASFRK